MMNRISTVMMVFAGFLVLAVYGSGFVYVGFKVFRFLRAVISPSGVSVLSGISHMHIFIGLCVFFVLSIAAGFIPFDKSIQKHFVWFAWLAIGTVLYLLMTFLVSDLALLIGRLTHLIASPTPQNVIIAASCAVFAVTAVFAGISIYNAKQIKHASYEVTINTGSGTVGSLQPGGTLNAVLISDTHFGYLNDDKWAAKIAYEINTLSPDIVFIAGDIFNDNYAGLANPDKAAASLQSIDTKYGIYASLGNHDSGSTFSEMQDFLERSNVTVLQDEHVVIDDRFVVLGRTDPTPIRGGQQPRGEITDVLGAIDKQHRKLPLIVIDHQPGFIDEYGNNADLLLAGHTHAGIFFPATIITQLMNGERNYGYSQKDPDSPHVIVTSGAGLWGPPFRLGSDNEIVSINITFN